MKEGYEHDVVRIYNHISFQEILEQIESSAAVGRKTLVEHKKCVGDESAGLSTGNTRY